MLVASNACHQHAKRFEEYLGQTPHSLGMCVPTDESKRTKEYNLLVTVYLKQVIANGLGLRMQRKNSLFKSCWLRFHILKWFIVVGFFMLETLAELEYLT